MTLEEMNVRNRLILKIVKALYKSYFDKEMTLETPITPFENHLLNLLAEKIYNELENKEEEK